ncbi:hypothetical protein BZL35_00562 [Candidatus Pandoraea novymonadis]|uniref:Uncharacterized protein n=1 Tax=Candidatus Pandoraea novymonadis TaxID=1808959 RepID=A0ABX5FGL6_9BURK|nr:hypothetical protein BZL35_00562 [Candidatus Pandoraea novymonadis]
MTVNAGFESASQNPAYRLALRILILIFVLILSWLPIGQIFIYPQYEA